MDHQHHLDFMGGGGDGGGGGGGGGDGRVPRKELQGPRPTPLKVRNDSHKIRKPPVPPPQGQHFNHRQQPPPQPPRQPVIIYAVSPKVIHANPSEFMTLVQRLTGPNQSTSSPSSSSTYTPMSPAARLASIEKTKIPLEARKRVLVGLTPPNEVVEIEIDGDVGVERTVIFPGILSPGPGSLPPISPNFFSPLFRDPSILNILHHDSSLGHCGSSIPSPFPSNFFSPSTMFSPSSLDLLHQILEN